MDEFLDIEKASPRYERDRKIIKMIEDGHSYAEIGRQINLTRARVSQIALQHGYVVRPSLVNPDNVKENGRK